MDKIYYFISGGIVLLGLIFFFFLIWKSRRLKKLQVEKPEAIKHYEKSRDKLTFRKKVEDKLDEIELPSFSLGNFIGAFIVVLIGVSLLPTIAQQVNITSETSNVTGVSDTVVGLTTIFFTLAIVGAALTIAFSSFRSSGLI